MYSHTARCAVQMVACLLLVGCENRYVEEEPLPEAPSAAPASVQIEHSRIAEGVALDRVAREPVKVIE